MASARLSPDKLALEAARRGLSLSAFAAQCGVAKDTLTRILKGDTVSQVTHSKLAQGLLNIPVSETHAALLDEGAA